MLDTQFFIPHIYQLILKSICVLPENMKRALEATYQRETAPLARVHMETTLRHMKLSKEKMIPLCGDTGFPIFFVRMGSEIFVEGGVPALARAIKAAVQKATEDAVIRPTMINPYYAGESGDERGNSHALYRS